MVIPIMAFKGWYDNTKAKFEKGNFNRNHNKIVKGDSLLICWLFLLFSEKKKKLNI